MLTTGDVTYTDKRPPPTTLSATDCYGLISNGHLGSSGGNASTAIVNQLWGNGLGALTTWGSDPFVELVKKDTGQWGPGQTVLGHTWSLDGSTAATTGTWTLTADPLIGLPKFFDFVVVLKGSDDSAAYLFNEAWYDGSGGGSWTMKIDADGGKNNKFNPAGLSNLTIYGRLGSTPPPPPPPPPNGGGGGQGNPVPEPGTLALVAAALLALGSMRRRRKN